MLATLFLGLAMNISSSYLIAAVLGAPVLVVMGFEPLGVHMFILFFAAMATITPPVAVTSYATAAIAGANPMKVGFMSMKVGIVAYVLPFVFIFNPAILQYGSVLEVIMAVITCIIGTGVLAMGVEGWFFDRKTGFLVRLLLTISGILIVIGKWLFIGAGALIIAFILLYYFIKLMIEKKAKVAVNEEI
jgi:TRAP-type uncharacterized transport system fused permease subunit